MGIWAWSFPIAERLDKGLVRTIKLPSQAVPPKLPVHILRGKPLFQYLPTPRYEITNGKIQYGDATVEADQIELVPNPDSPPLGDAGFSGVGTAKGHVILKSSSVTIQCVFMTFNWTDKSGKAIEPKIQIPNLSITADQLNIENGEYVFSNAVVHQTGALKNLGVKSKTLKIVPGRYIASENGSVLSGDHSLFGFRRYTANLDNQLTGFHFPYPSYSSLYGFGLTFNSIFALPSGSNLGIGVGASQFALPSYSVQYVKDLGGDKSPKVYSTEQVFDQRFSSSFLDSVENRSVDSEFSDVSSAKSRLGFSSIWNVEPTDRNTTNSYILPLQVGFETGGLLGKLGIKSDSYLQTVGFAGGRTFTRAAGLESISAPPISLGSRLTWINQMDAGIYAGQSSFTWLRPLTGLSASLSPMVRMTLGLYASAEAGTPQFPMDQLYSRSGSMVRADFTFGSRTLSVLTKYDISRRKAFDTEIYFEQTAGLYKPYIIYKTFPSTLKFGIEIRFNSILDGIFHGEEKVNRQITYKL